MTLFVSQIRAPEPSAQTIELVERKGIGHPDTICDALAERLSIELSRYYLERFGLILHHNVDKTLIRGGTSHVQFGGGTVVQPIEIYLCGRATGDVNGIKVPVDDIAVESAQQWCKEHLHAIDCVKDVKFHCLIRPGSKDMVDLYMRQRKTGVILANDTSCGAGFAPLDELEQLVLFLERHLNGAQVRSDHPQFGEDIKVMALRLGDSISITIACALISSHILNIEDYFAAKATLSEIALDQARRLTGRKVTVYINTADNPDTNSIYLTVTGTSAEAGDDGEVGRGNRANGLITPYRPMTVEAVAGKNPVTHVGKIYNVAALRIAQSIIREIEEAEEAYCYLASQIGRPIQEPQVIDLRIRTREGIPVSHLISTIETIVQSELSCIGGIWRDFVEGSVMVY